VEHGYEKRAGWGGKQFLVLHSGLILLGSGIFTILAMSWLVSRSNVSALWVAIWAPVLFAGLSLLAVYLHLRLRKSFDRLVDPRSADLRKSQKMLATILDSLDAVVYVADISTYEIVFLNKFARKIFGDRSGSICWQVLQTGQTGPCDFCTNKYLVDEEGRPTGMYAWEFKNTLDSRWYDIRDRAIQWLDGRLVRIEVATDVTDRKQADFERERILGELRDALAHVKTLSGFLPICSSCKKIRDDAGYWNQVEAYVMEHSQAEFTHGLCPECIGRLYPEYSPTKG